MRARRFGAIAWPSDNARLRAAAHEDVDAPGRP